MGGVLACILLGGFLFASAHQKGQWVPGQFGLSAGVIPDPGITYANLSLNYSASRLNDSDGNRILQNVTGTYSFWLNENVAYYVPNHKVLGGYFMPYVCVNFANGSLMADIPGTNLGVNGGGASFADLYVQPVKIKALCRRMSDSMIMRVFSACPICIPNGATNTLTLR